MKTKNNVRKAAIKSLTVVTGLMLIGLAVNAQISSFFENTGKSPMAMVAEKTMKSAFATSVNTKTLFKTDAFAFYLTNETDEPLHLEDWMLNENRFTVNDNKTELVEKKEGNKTISTPTFIYVEANEERALKVEKWMVNPKIWGR